MSTGGGGLAATLRLPVSLKLGDPGPGGPESAEQDEQQSRPGTGIGTPARPTRGQAATALACPDYWEGM
jgi:hypothetical protein